VGISNSRKRTIVNSKERAIKYKQQDLSIRKPELASSVKKTKQRAISSSNANTTSETKPSSPNKDSRITPSINTTEEHSP
jgi:hypothetical protein